MASIGSRGQSGGSSVASLYQPDPDKNPYGGAGNSFAVDMENGVTFTAADVPGAVPWDGAYAFSVEGGYTNDAVDDGVMGWDPVADATKLVAKQAGRFVVLVEFDLTASTQNIPFQIVGGDSGAGSGFNDAIPAGLAKFTRSFVMYLLALSEIRVRIDPGSLADDAVFSNIALLVTPLESSFDPLA